MKRLNQLITLLLKSSFFFICCTLIIISHAYASSADVEQPVNIDADSVVFNQRAGTAVYSGNVQISQGSLSIAADHIDISAPNNEIRSIKATGRPVRFQQKMDNGKLAIGNARTIQYFVIERRLVLDGDATLSQDQDVFNSNRMEYSTATGELKAGRITGDGQTGGRVRATFFPTNQAR